VWSELRERVAQYDSRTSDMRLGGGGVAAAATRNYCMCRILMHWPATFPISREGRRFITFIITLFRGVGASAAHT
jgi:hypothetical protein